MTDDVTGARKGDYLILGTLGAGGMGKVYKVRNTLSDRVEAMKVLLPDLSEQQELADRFLREIKVLASLHHPNIAELRTALTIGNQLVMIMEYVEGTTLASRLQQGDVRYADALVYFDQVLAALACAHSQRIVHRDIKPANIMLAPFGVVKLMDFGIARSGNDMGLTMTGTTLGSVAYMSPEQVRCEPLDGRSDLYSVGVSLYETITGQRPYVSDNNFEVMQAHLQVPPTAPIELKPDIPPGLNQLILMAMAKNPAQRFQTADAMRAAQRRACAGRTNSVCADDSSGVNSRRGSAADVAPFDAQRSACGHRSATNSSAHHGASGHRSPLNCAAASSAAHDSGSAARANDSARRLGLALLASRSFSVKNRDNASERRQSQSPLHHSQCGDRVAGVDCGWVWRETLDGRALVRKCHHYTGGQFDAGCADDSRGGSCAYDPEQTD